MVSRGTYNYGTNLQAYDSKPKKIKKVEYDIPKKLISILIIIVGNQKVKKDGFKKKLCSF